MERINHIKNIDLSHPLEKYKSRYKSLLRANVDLFSRNDLDVGHCRSLPYKVRLKDPNRIRAINQYRLPVILSTISHFHCRSYFSSPTTSRAVTRSLHGAKRLFGYPSVPRKIIMKSILTSLYALTLRPDATFVLFRTVWRIFIEFYGLLRFSEVSNLTFSDITWCRNAAQFLSTSSRLANASHRFWDSSSQSSRSSKKKKPKHQIIPR